MKKTAVFIIFALIAVMLCTVGASADCGPHSSVKVTFPDADTEFYVTLLSKADMFGPYSARDALERRDRYGDEGKNAAYGKFCDYADADGFYFLGELGHCGGGTGVYDWRWGYYPPETFKVLVYYPGTDSFETSAVVTQYAFSSYFTIGGIGSGTLTVKQSYNYALEAAGFALRVLLTLAIELLIAKPFGYLAPRTRRTVIITNIATQVLLNLGLNIINFQAGWLVMAMSYILLEISVFVIEGIIYTFTLSHRDDDGRRRGIAKAWLFSLTANLASFVIGGLITRAEFIR